VVATAATFNVRLLTLDDVDGYVRHVARVDADSGADGVGHSHPYGKSDPVDVDEARGRETTRWTTEIDQPGWRRAWGLFDEGELIGHLYLAGGALRSELHRVSLGMGIARSHRRRGGGSLLLATAIRWARVQPSIVWIDLGVFSDNAGAQALYAQHGFHVLGETPDRFRVDGQSLDDISMTLNVAHTSR
jgi:RimJ/RimL family protein N-acetyltransferase